MHRNNVRRERFTELVESKGLPVNWLRRGDHAEMPLKELKEYNALIDTIHQRAHN